MTVDARKIQLAVFCLVAASFTNIYITQPILPVLQNEFSVDAVVVSFSVSAVILGIALANLPFGFLSDRFAVQPIVLAGGLAVALGGAVCAVAENFWTLIAARFLQGLFVPAMTTCVAAYLAKTLPKERLNVAMGAYVSATVVGGLGGRLIGGFLYAPQHWRRAIATAALFVLLAALTAWRALPRDKYGLRENPASKKTAGYLELLKRADLWLIFSCAAGGLAIFSSIFNFLPFRLSAPPFGFSTATITAFYFVYVMGVFTGPVAGRISNRFGYGTALLGGSCLLALSLASLLAASTAAIITGLLLLCAGFFTVHAAAVGALNRKLDEGQGRANALYVLFYYAGGWLGITGCGFAYEHGGWSAVVFACMFFLLLPLGAGIVEKCGEGRGLK